MARATRADLQPPTNFSRNTAPAIYAAAYVGLQREKRSFPLFPELCLLRKDSTLLTNHRQNGHG